MTNTLEFENCLKIGFINNADVYEVRNYEENFDVLVMHDGDLSFVNYLIAAIAGENYDWNTYPTFKWVHEKLNEALD